MLLEMGAFGNGCFWKWMNWKMDFWKRCSWKRMLLEKRVDMGDEGKADMLKPKPKEFLFVEGL